MKEVDKERLSEQNGKNGKPAWVAHGGRVFDVTESKLWPAGMHMGRHGAGRDMTEEIKAAPHGPEMLERYPQVGTITGDQTPAAVKETPAPVREAPLPLSALLARFPMLRRHPHPMAVHFPIVFMFSAPIFALLYLAFGVVGFDQTAFYCISAGLVFIPVAIISGYYTWWLNYMAQPIRAVSIKKGLSAVLLCVDVVAFVWRATAPDILLAASGGRILYVLLLLLLLPLVVALGWYGATLTFPIEKG